MKKSNSGGPDDECLSDQQELCHRSSDSQNKHICEDITASEPSVKQPKKRGPKKKPLTKEREVRLKNRRVRANARERSRMHGLNHALEALRRHVPNFSATQRLSKIETLRLAKNYIRTLSELLIREIPPTPLEMAFTLTEGLSQNTSNLIASTLQVSPRALIHLQRQSGSSSYEVNFSSDWNTGSPSVLVPHGLGTPDYTISNNNSASISIPMPISPKGLFDATPNVSIPPALSLDRLPNNNHSFPFSPHNFETVTPNSVIPLEDNSSPGELDQKRLYEWNAPCSYPFSQNPTSNLLTNSQYSILFPEIAPPLSSSSYPGTSIYYAQPGRFSVPNVCPEPISNPYAVTSQVSLLK